LHWLDQALRPLLTAAFVEWRYYSVISAAFHGIVCMAMFNPLGGFRRVAEGGLLLLVAGVFNSPRQADLMRQAEAHQQVRQLCWMHLFPLTSLHFTGPHTARLQARHDGIQLCAEQYSPQHAYLELCHPDGLELRFQHRGLEHTAIVPHTTDDFRRVPGAHWTVYNPSPIALTSGELTCTLPFLQHIAQQQSDTSINRVSAQLLANATNGYHTRWHDASGYYEHSFGINPLPLHGWDFLFVPDAARGQGLVLQTYVRSQSLRYIEMLWREAGKQCYTRFTADQFQLSWHDCAVDPAIGVPLPRKRTLRAHKPGLHLEVENNIPYQIAFLRTEKLAVRHFFIVEHIGFCSWQLTDDTGRILAEAYDQPAGGEIAHARLTAPPKDTV
jgi:hypothetical protein